MAVVIAITSGKGGVGKTNIATNLGLALAARDARVCVFDADTGLANINIVLGIHPQYTLEQVLSGELTMNDIIVESEVGLSIVPAASGVESCTDLSEQKRQFLVDALAQLEQRFDYILIDTAAGIDSSVLDFVASAQFRVVVITREPTSLTDSFALLKMLANKGAKRNLYALVNQVDNYKTSQKVFRRFQTAVEKYLNLKINYLGYLANDQALMNAVSRQVPVVVDAPESSVSCCFFALADIVKRQFVNEKKRPYFSRYWQKIAGNRVSRKNAQVNKTNHSLRSQTQGHGQKTKPAWNDVVAFIERQHYPESQCRELISGLERYYEKHYGKPLKTTEEVVSSLLTHISDSEERAEILLKALSKSVQRQTLPDQLDDPLDKVIHKMKGDGLSRQEFSSLMKQFGHIYQDRFGVRYFNDAEQILDLVTRLLKQNQTG